MDVKVALLKTAAMKKQQILFYLVLFVADFTLNQRYDKTSPISFMTKYKTFESHNKSHNNFMITQPLNQPHSLEAGSRRRDKGLAADRGSWTQTSQPEATALAADL